MKKGKIFSGIFVIVLCTLVLPMSRTQALFTDNMVAFWNMNETSGSRADGIGSSTMTQTGTVASTTGKISNAAQFSGSNNLSATDNAAISMGDIDFTIAGWVYMTAKTSDRGIAMKWGATREYGIWYESAQDKFSFTVSSNGSNATSVRATALGSPSINTWYYVVGWHDAAANTINIQVNNGTVTSASYSTGVFNGTAALQIGALNSGSRLAGNVDAVGLWKKVLTSTERTDLYNAGNGAEYPFSFTAPDAPTSLNATSNAGVINLAWTAPASNGGASIIDYVIEYKLSTDASWTTFSDSVSTSTSANVTGLTPNVSYDFRVSAVNGIGTGTASSTDTETPILAAPDAPTNLLAFSTTSQTASLTWTAPVLDGGSAITDYLVEYKLSTDASWTTFSDGTSTSPSTTVTGLTNGLLHNFRVSAINTIGTGTASSTANSIPESNVVDYDQFTGTSFNARWTETDSASSGSGGTVGNVQQNGSVSILGNNNWGTNALATVSTYDRTNADLSVEVSVSRSSCGSGVGPVAIGYGDINFSTAGKSAYILISNGTAWELYYWLNGVNQTSTPITLTGITSCTNNVPILFRLTANSGGGVSVYVNGSSTASATTSSGTFTNKSFFLSAFATSGTNSYDNLRIISSAQQTPGAPTDFSASPASTQMGLTWTAPTYTGSGSITDYAVEYKLSTDSSWTTFTDGVSTSTSATVTGLTNATSYNFRVAGINNSGTGSYSDTVTATPTGPTAPAASSVAVLGNPNVSQSIRGTYTYSDANNDPEATSTYRWLVAATSNGTYSAISGATGSSYTIQSGDLTKYIKFEVTPIANTSPTNGTAVTSSAFGPIVADADYYNHILSTGQSLSVGINGSPALSTTQPYSNKKLSGSSLVALVEASVETMASALGNTITANVAGNDYDDIVTNHGVNGYPYASLKKGTVPYTTGITQVTNARNASITAGRPYRVTAVTTVHGETDQFNGTTGAEYKDFMVEWQHDYETDVEAITGQTGTIPMFMTQMSSYFASYSNAATSEIPIAQLAAADENPGKIYLVGPKYFFNYSDRHHLTNASYRWMGEYYGKVIKKVTVDGETDWRPLEPDTVTRQGNIIYADFHVPEGNLVFDTTLVDAKTNYGFEYYDTTASASISAVEIMDDDTVKITLSSTPTGANQRLRYAYTGTVGVDAGAHSAGSAGGNLRDTDNFPSAYSNTMYNWAVHFDQAITDDTSAPTAPTSLTATPGDTQMALDWDAPASDGGSAITDYVIEYKLAAAPSWTTFSDGTSTTSATTVTGLTNNQSYNFRVSAVNAIGTGTVSSTATATPSAAATEPDAPTSVIATRGNTQIGLSWTAPVSNGGSAITDYLVEYKLSTDSSWTTFTDGVSTSTSATVTGLVNGSSYNFRVSATNTIGTGSASSTATATPATVPGAPTGLAATPGELEVALDWTAPVSNGGSSVTDYIVEYKLSTDSSWTTFSDGTSTSTSTTVTGLTGDLSYDFRVSTVNAVGTGSASTPDSATPSLVTTEPDQPTGLSTGAGDGQVALSWTAPANDGNSSITDYVIEYKLSIDSSWTTFSDGTSTDTAATVTGLVNGESYDFRVSATNAVGTGSPSATATDTPTSSIAAPAVPRNLEAVPDNTQASLTWDIPLSDGGSAITDYLVEYKLSADMSWTTFSESVDTATTTVVTGLTNGESYDFRVSAINGAGTGSASGTASTTPATIPGRPTGLTATAGESEVSLDWFAPASDGGSSITDYLIEYKLSIDSSWTTFIDGITNTINAVITGLTGDLDYDFRVSAINPVGTSLASDPASATPTAPSTVPDAPTGLSGIGDDTTVSLTWTAPASDGGLVITDYIIQYKRSDQLGWNTFSDGTDTATAATVTGLTNDLSYDFRVFAVNDLGQSAASDTATAMPAATPGPIISGRSANPDHESATISWTTDQIASSMVEYGLTSSYGLDTSELDTAPRVTSHNVSITGLTVCTTYHYRISSTNGSLVTTTGSDAEFTTSGCSNRSSSSRSGSSPSRPSRPVPLPVVPVTVPVLPPVSHFFRTLSYGMSGNDVLLLQKFLNAIGFTIAASGPGSPGHETNYFGNLTKSALIRYQNANADKILKPLGLTQGTGLFGPSTRQFVNNILEVK